MVDITDWTGEVHRGDAVETLRDMPSNSVHCCITSPPFYGLRNYNVEGQIGLEETLGEYIHSLVKVGEELQRVLRDDGSFWLNLGDTYSGGGGVAGKPDDWDDLHNDETYPDSVPARNTSYPDKCKMLVPHRTAIALIDSGWICRNDAVWVKPNPMPESVTDRLSTTFEFFFHFVQKKDYYYDLDSIREPYADSSQERYNYTFRDDLESQETTASPAVGAGDIDQNNSGKNPGDVFEITTAKYPEAHFAVYPEELIGKPIKASCPPDGIVLDPFIGSGTTAVVAENLGREWIGIDLNKDYVDMSEERIRDETYIETGDIHTW